MQHWRLLGIRSYLHMPIPFCLLQSLQLWRMQAPQTRARVYRAHGVRRCGASESKNDSSTSVSSLGRPGDEPSVTKFYVCGTWAEKACPKRCTLVGRDVPLLIHHWIAPVIRIIICSDAIHNTLLSIIDSCFRQITPGMKLFGASELVKSCNGIYKMMLLGLSRWSKLRLKV